MAGQVHLRYFRYAVYAGIQLVAVVTIRSAMGFLASCMLKMYAVDQAFTFQPLIIPLRTCGKIKYPNAFANRLIIRGLKIFC
jgi:hypothetical protein